MVSVRIGCSRVFNELPHLLIIFAPGRRLNAATDIDPIRPDLRHREGNIIRGQPAPQNNWRALHRLRRNLPREGSAGPPRPIGDMGVQHELARPRIVIHDLQIVRTPNPNRLDKGSVKMIASIGALLTVELYKTQSAHPHDSLNLLRCPIHEHPDSRHKRGELSDNRGGCLRLNVAGRPLHEDEPQGIGPRLHRSQGIVARSKATDLHPYHRSRSLSRSPPPITREACSRGPGSSARPRRPGPHPPRHRSDGGYPPAG